MINYYEVLGLKNSASQQEIRRAYRILARRYHPDLNPGKSSEERFKQIASAHEVLSDVEKRKAFDAELDTSSRIKAGFDAYRRAQQQHPNSRPSQPHRPAARRPEQPPRAAAPPPPSFFSKLGTFTRIISSELKSHGQSRPQQRPSPERPPPPPSESTEKNINKSVHSSVHSVALIEVSLSLTDAIYGTRKSVEVGEGNERRKYSVTIPPGVRYGSLIRMRSSRHPDEELVVVLRVAHHPFVSIQNKGLMVELAITIAEAIKGASLLVPTLDGQETMLIPAGTQTGTEFRIAGKGILNTEKIRGDIFFRVLVHVPTCHTAVGILEKADELSAYYESPVRSPLPSNFMEWL